MATHKLTRLELRIMEALWNQGRLSVREILETFPEPERPAYSTIQTTVYRLEEKGAVAWRGSATDGCGIGRLPPSVRPGPTVAAIRRRHAAAAAARPHAAAQRRLRPLRAAGVRRCDRRFVAALRSERVVNIDDRRHLAEETDLIAAQTLRVAGAVEPLMMMGGDANGAFIHLGFLEQFVAVTDVLLHNLKFRVR